MASKVAMIEVSYPGGVISSNHYLGKTKDGGFYVKSEAQAWMDEIGWQLKQFHIEDWKLPLHVTCSGRFTDKRSQPDLSNLSKCALDAIQEVTGIDDQNMRWHDGIVVYGNYPRIWLKIEES